MRFLRVFLFIFLATHVYSAMAMEEVDYQRIYLATPPRSGNHWMRYLIEDLTGVATSSVYIDRIFPLHLGNPFPWGGYSVKNGYMGNCRYPEKGERVVIKTHYPFFNAVPFDLQHYIMTIRVVRHPVDSFYSYHVRKKNSLGSPIDSNFLMHCINKWRRFQEYWDKQENVLTIRYEDLMTHPHRTLKKVMDAMGYHFTDDDIKRTLAEFPPKGTILKHMKHFSNEDLLLIHQELGDLLVQFGYEIPGILEFENQVNK